MEKVETWNAPELRRRLLGWYDANRRDLPWRRSRDPYSIWVSEIMLQQTRVAAVVPKFHAFMARFPTANALADAAEQEVLALWSGLGYYRRARMLHQGARLVAGERGGRMPETAGELRGLPGVGAYTAAAIASIAHGEAVAVVDGNVERVVCRMAGWDAIESVKLRRKVEATAARLLDPRRPGDFNQAMMELGATVCLPRNPRCLQCPIRAMCATRGEHKTTPRAPMHARDAAYALCRRTGKAGKTAILLEQRYSHETVMPGLWQLPELRCAEVRDEELMMTVRHAIMQVNYRVRIRGVNEPEVSALTRKGGRRRWIPLTELASMALTGLARKVLLRAKLLPLPSGAPRARAVLASGGGVPQ